MDRRADEIVAAFACSICIVTKHLGVSLARYAASGNLA
jgi:hypothetical protein